MEPNLSSATMSSGIILVRSGPRRFIIFEAQCIGRVRRVALLDFSHVAVDHAVLKAAVVADARDSVSVLVAFTDAEIVGM